MYCNVTMIEDDHDDDDDDDDIYNEFALVHGSQNAVHLSRARAHTHTHTHTHTHFFPLHIWWNESCFN